ncbi:MAG: hypothetical protein Q4A79_00350 [Candidatus Saccharibacteria bacterium]|nr:hypothetical protein [Candidatus Saccharibacteria bacterium]
MDKTTEKTLKKSLKLHARALGLPDGASELFIEHTITNVKKSLKTKKVITESDLNRLVARELKKFNADLAYVYQNCDKII